MSSPFLRNRERKLAQQSGQAAAANQLRAPDAGTEAGQAYAALKVQLDDHLRQLSDTESLEARRPMKAEFAKHYAAWIDGVIAADAPVQDEILLTCMIWAIDTGDFEEAVRLGEFALKHGLTMPERYNRSVACFLREDIATAALADPESVDLPMLARVDELTQGADMHDQAKAKLHKALGQAWLAKADDFDPSDDSAPAGGEAAFVDEALTQFKRALALDQKVGVKKAIERLESRARKLAEAEQT